MNEIVFVKHTLSTVIVNISIEKDPYDIFENIQIGNFGKCSHSFHIIAKYFKKTDGTFEVKGVYSHTLKALNNTFTFYCSFGGKKFKIRWFHSRNNKIHIASGLTQELSYEAINEFVKATRFMYILSRNNVLANGIATAKLGINLYDLSMYLENSGLSFVYTPDRHAALKLYTEHGTACIFSTGKILYMGSKSTETLYKLHSFIQYMGCHWNGVTLFNSSSKF